MCRRLMCLVLVALALSTSNVAQAKLFEPPLQNPSFELPDLGPGNTSQWGYNADDWILNSYQAAYLEDGTWFAEIPEFQGRIPSGTGKHAAQVIAIWPLVYGNKLVNELAFDLPWP